MMTVAEFRKDLRKAFEKAPVQIIRYGEVFELRRLNEKDVPKPKIPTRKELIQQRFSGEKRNRNRAEIVLCKHGYHPEFCKYAKPGEPCK